MIGIMAPPCIREDRAAASVQQLLVSFSTPPCLWTGAKPSDTLSGVIKPLEAGMNRRFEVYQYRQVLLHMRQGETDRNIAKARLLGRRKASIVRAIAAQEGWLDPQNPLPDDSVLKEKLMPSERRASTISSVEPFAELISEWVKNGVQATTIWDALRRDKGFTGHYSSVRRFVQKIKPPVHSPTMILDFKPGEAAQVDFGTGPVVIDDMTGKPVKTWFFVMTLAFSRHQYAELVKNQKISTWLGCHRRAFEFFGGVPQKAIIDNLKSAITRACSFDPEIQRSYEMLAEGYEFLISPCPPADPEKKGRVESGVKYLKKSFMPLRTFRNLTDANRQLKDWVLTTAGCRIHGTTGKKPLELFQTSEKSFLKPLPLNPPEIVEWAKASLQRNTHVWFDYAWYSAPHSLIGQELWLRAGPQTLQIYHADKLVVKGHRFSPPGAVKNPPPRCIDSDEFVCVEPSDDIISAIVLPGITPLDFMQSFRKGKTNSSFSPPGPTLFVLKRSRPAKTAAAWRPAAPGRRPGWRIQAGVSRPNISRELLMPLSPPAFGSESQT